MPRHLEKIVAGGVRPRRDALTSHGQDIRAAPAG